MPNEISKRDAFSFQSKAHAEAGRRLWDRSGKQGRLANSSMDAEATALKTWILFKNAYKGEPEAIIECEIYPAPRASNAEEAVGMLHGMCPKCGETFLVREDNKSMTLGHVAYKNVKGHLKEQWERHCRETLRRHPRDADKIAVVSSPERWQCDYCKAWCVRVTDSIAITDMSGATQIIVSQSTRTGDNGKIEHGVSIKESGIIL
jgi:ribosomal protein S27AE